MQLGHFALAVFHHEDPKMRIFNSFATMGYATKAHLKAT